MTRTEDIWVTLDNTPLRLFTRFETATLGGYSTTR